MTPSKLALVPLKYRDNFLEYIDTCAENLLRLHDIWETSGLPEERIDKRMDKLLQWINERWTTVIDDELQMQEEQKARVKAALEELSELCAQLEVDPPEQPPGLNLQQQLDWVVSSSASVESVRAERKALYSNLRQQEKELLARMTDIAQWKMTPSNTARGTQRTLPNEEDLREFSSHVKMLREEKRIRLDKMRPLIEACCTLMERMCKVPQLSVEEDLSTISTDQWDLTVANLKRVTEARDALSLEEAQLHSRHTSLISVLTKLFDRLEVTQIERTELLESLLQSKTYQTVARLEELVAEYEALKRANMASFVEKLRKEAKDCYEALRLGSEWEEPAAISDLLQQGPSEELIVEYEKLIGSLRDRQAKLQPLFKLLDERQQLLEMLKELEEAQRDPSRFKNRGGALLQETKKRERVNKNLPLVAKQIVKFLDSHEPLYGEVIIDGKSIRETIGDLEDKRPRSACASYATPLKTANRGLVGTPSSVRAASQLGHRSGLLKRAGTCTDIKAKPSSLRQTTLAKAQTVGKVYTRHMAMKSPSSAAKTKLTSVPRTLRRSMSYGDFEGQLSSMDDLHSTRIGKPSGKISTANPRSRKLQF